MEKRNQINALLNARFDKAPIQVWPALVKSVQGTSCTIDFINTDLVDVEGVNLRADEDATEGVLLVPRVGSLVLVGVVENEISNLYVCQVSEVDQVKAVIGNTTLTASKDGVTASRDQVSLSLTDKATLKQGQTVIEAASGKVSVKNATVDLKGIFDDLATMLQSFQVICSNPGAPSASVFPATLTLITQFKTKVSQLLA
jgi:hypothetical protein